MESALLEGRFELLQSLGSGGFGEVYEAQDRERDERVALKMLRHQDGDSIYRIKQEFRILADIQHPNLASLFELFEENGQWFFTMERVFGRDFLSHIRSFKDKEQPAPDFEATVSLHPSYDEGRLRDSVRQLAEGLAALHREGKLHRDIKPANVLVEDDGRVVLLDFGMATALAAQDQSDVAGGSPIYMAPEQATSATQVEATDWYGVGTLLYQALTGEYPYRGTLMEILVHKQTFDPISPAELIPGVPRDLDALCMDLLQRDPDRRPCDVEVLRRLGSRAQEGEDGITVRDTSEGVLFGRDEELLLLTRAYEQVRQGIATTVHVHGRSGVGKSTLMRRFIDGLVPGPEPVVLEGRCYEQESVPYKALDSLIDALSRYLRRLEDGELQSLLPQRASSLVRLFPVLRRVEALAAHPLDGGPEAPEPIEERRRGFAALRELLGRLGQRPVLVLWLDDVQWGDTDSAALLSELLRLPDPPTLMLVASYREEALKHGSFVQRLRAVEVREGESQRLDLALRPLDGEAAAELALSMMGQQGTRGVAESIARESRGNPFFVQTLVRFAATARDDGQASAWEVSLEDALQALLANVPAAVRVYLELVSVATRPLSRRVLVAAGPEGGNEPAAMRALRAAQLVRPTSSSGQPLVEPFHGRVREAVVRALDPDRGRDRHRRLAEVLEQTGEADPEELAYHFEGAGNRPAAARYAQEAAANASDALAFDRAAEFYQRALDLRGEEREAERGLLVNLADALAHAGRGAEAAPVFLRSAEGASPRAALERRRQAAEEWLKSGHIDEGLEVLQQVLPAVGLKLAATPRGAQVTLLMRRAQLKVRGLKFQAREADQIPAELLKRIDICFSVATGLGMADFIRSAEFQTRSLLLSLDAGEPSRIARALAMEAAFSAAGGRGRASATAVLLERASRLADEVDEPFALGIVQLVTGLIAYQEGRFKDIHDPAQRGEVLLRPCPGASWELNNAHLYVMEGLGHTGQLRRLREVQARYLEEARDRGSLWGLLGARVQTHLLPLAADDPEEAQRDVDEAMAPYTDQGANIPHYWAFYARGQIALYRGDARAALALVDRWWEPFRKGQLLRVEVARTAATYLRGRALLAAAGEGGAELEDRLRGAERDARSLAGEGVPWCEGAAWLLLAGIATARGESAAAVTKLRLALERFTELEMRLYQAAARRRLGQVIGGEDGAAEIRAADRWMAEEGIVNPRRMVAMLAPAPGVSAPATRSS